MPDITMCKGEDCKLKNECYRYTAKPSKYRQSYFIGQPYHTNNKGEQECTEIMPLWKKD